MFVHSSQLYFEYLLLFEVPFLFFLLSFYNLLSYLSLPLPYPQSIFCLTNKGNIAGLTSSHDSCFSRSLKNLGLVLIKYTNL